MVIDYKINRTPSGLEVIAVRKQFSFMKGEEATVANVKESHLKNAIYFTRKKEIDILITDLTGALRAAKDCCDNPHVSAQLLAAINHSEKFIGLVNESVDKLKLI